MKLKLFKQGGKKLAIAFIVVSSLLLSINSAFAVIDETGLQNSSLSMPASGGNVRFIAVAKGDDAYIFTEDTLGTLTTYPDNNVGYDTSFPPYGVAYTDSTNWPTSPSNWVTDSDTYQIWISSISDNQTGYASGTIGPVGPSGTKPTTPGDITIPTPNPLILSGPTNYMAEPGNFQGYGGDKKAFLDWNSVVGATKYRIFRGPVVGSTYAMYQRIATTTETHYVDKGITNESTYYYIVVPMNSANWYGVHTNQIAVKPTDNNDPVLSSLNPSTGPIGQTVIITGIDLGTGVGTVEFNGVKVPNGDCDWSNVLTGTVTVKVPTGTTTGDVYLITNAGLVSNPLPFTIGSAAAPDIVSCSPNAPSAYQGDQNVNLTIVGTNTAFTVSTTATISGTGITVNSVTRIDDTQATVNITVRTDAAATSRDITMITGTQVATGEGRVIIDPPSFSINPTGGARGTSFTITVAGVGSHFLAGTTAEVTGGNITTEVLSVTPPTAMTFRVYVSNEAVTSPPNRNVVLRTDLGARGIETIVLANIFDVNGSASPNILSINPPAGNRSLTGVTITGVNFGANRGYINMESILASIESWSDTQIRFTVPINVERKAYTVTVTTSTDVFSQTATTPFTVNAASPLTFSPTNTNPGESNVLVTIDGVNTWIMPTITAPDVDFGGTITVNSVTYVSPTRITVSINVPTNEGSGPHLVSIVSDNIYSEVYSGSFTVLGGPAPVPVGSIMPAYPNPFNPLDTLNPLTMPISVAVGNVDIYIFDQAARLIWKTSTYYAFAGAKYPQWDGRNNFGSIVNNGYYMIRVVQNSRIVATGRILVRKR